MNGFRDTEDKKDCTNCKYFYSWQDIHDQDPLEPSEFGRCENDKMELDETFGEGSVCDMHKSKFNEI